MLRSRHAPHGIGGRPGNAAARARFAPAALPALAERLRAAIAACAVAVAPGHTLKPTASIGMAAFPEDAGTDAALFELADRALYAAKRGGRDRVAAASGPPTSDRTNNL